MQDYISLGATPPDEPCAQVGTKDYFTRGEQECKRFIDLIRRKIGPEPEGAELACKEFQHEFGPYLEVVCKYDERYPEAQEYCFLCESKGPLTWDDTTPLTGEEAHR